MTRLERRMALWYAMLDLGFALQAAGLRYHMKTGHVWSALRKRWQRENRQTLQAHRAFLRALAHHARSRASRSAH